MGKPTGTGQGKSGKSGMPCFAVNTKLGTCIKLTHILFHVIINIVVL
jgi:hypothetical protein